MPTRRDVRRDIGILCFSVHAFSLLQTQHICTIDSHGSYNRLKRELHRNHGVHSRLWYSCKRVKGRSHAAEKRISMHPHKPHATSQSCKCIPLRHANIDVFVSALCVVRALLREHEW